jgi:hypothetical protein
MEQIINLIWEHINKFGWAAVSSKKDHYLKMVKDSESKESIEDFRKEIMQLLMNAILTNKTIHEVVVEINNFENDNLL